MISIRSIFSAGITGMQVALVDAEWYLAAILESGMMLLSVGDNWSWKASGTLQLAVKTAIRTSTSVLSLLHQMLLD